MTAPQEFALNPTEVHAAAAAIEQTRDDVEAGRGCLTQSGSTTCPSAESLVGEHAAAAFTRYQSSWLAEIGLVSEAVVEVTQAIHTAADEYTRTDSAEATRFSRQR